MDPERRQEMARAAVIGMHADGATAADAVNALTEALGMLMATISPDAAGLERNIQQFGEQMERFARVYWAERQNLPKP